jgi:hypothetical protein
MIRAIFGESLLFFVPFVLFALFLILNRRNPLRLSAWSQSGYWLVIAGLVCVLAAFVVTGLTSERHIGAFEPPHMENGRVVPGQFR